MSTRTIMIFPEFENMEIIDEIRGKYDPLAQLVRPHITIVFPFENQMSNNDIADILSVRLKNIKPFELVLNGISKQEDRFGNYLLLDVKEGATEICSIHKTLYDNEFKEYDLGLGYKPHMTVGKLPTIESLNAAYEEVKNIDRTFKTVVNKVSVEMIGEQDESIIIIEKELS
ncbi:MAG: 2'-5' RNA ligase family protein [Lachnospiraceae bacterium]|nr:2'-5' RNA ligase family protein [Lachnospiraceae bacterium]